MEQTPPLPVIVGMKNYRIIFYLAIWIMVMGITGSLRTGATMPIILNGIIGSIMIMLGFWAQNGSKTGFWVTIGWISLNFLSYSYMALFRISAHPNPTPGTYFIFGSMAVFCLITLVFLLKSKMAK